MELPNIEMESLQQKVEANIANWQSSDLPLAPLSDDQNEILYLIEDEVKRLFYDQPPQPSVQPKCVIDTYEAYIKWMVKVENEIRDETLRDQIIYFNTLSNQSNQLKDLVNALEDVGRALDSLAVSYQEISTNISSLRVAIDDVSKQIAKLKDTKETIARNLRHYCAYSILDNKIKQSTHVSNEFKNILVQIDDSLDYFVTFPHFKESYKFSEKFNKLLLICLGKIGYCVEETITAITSEISVNNDLMCSQEHIDPMFVYYGKFQSVGCKFVLLLSHIEENMEKHYLYKETLNHCQKVFFAQRSLIMKPGLLAALNDLVKTYKNQLFILFRSCCSFVLKVCQDELTCFGYFFKIESKLLDAYLEALCQQLYDTLRPCLIKINHLEILTELCVVLKAKLNENIAINRFTNTISQLVGDLEERIVFRANIFFEQDLLQYKPSPGDLAYPEKLHQLNIHTNKNSIIDLHGMWYPTVKRTLVCLSLLYFCLKKHLFQSLAREALTACAKTLEVAACNISVKKNNLNGRLFQIKHLLILREQISPFNFDNEPTLDTKATKSSIFSSTAILEFLLGENAIVRECSVHPKKEINKELKAACEDFVTHATTFLTENLVCWMREVKDLLKGNETLETDFTKASYVADVVNVVQKNIKRRIPELKQIMELYLANRETEMILFRLVKNKVLSIFLQMEEILKLGKYSQEDLLLIACPTSEQVNILICSVCLTS